MVNYLRVGSRGPEVSLVQKELNRHFKPALVVDGVFGSKTQAAVMRFQKLAGFHGRDVDGVVGPKTMLRLFQMFNVSISGTLTPKANQPPPPPPAKPTVTKPITTNTLPKPMPLLADQTKANAPEELPRWFQLSSQFGVQQSGRDGSGLQAQLGFTMRSRDYFPRSGANTIYHGAHFEAMFAPVLGIPLPPSSTYTGQLGVTVQPITDWFVLWDRLHLLTPSLGIYGQIPLNPPGGIPMVDDPATHSRVGGFVGLEFFHVDIIKDRLSLGLSGQESGYWDFHDDRVYWDPSILGFVQGTLGVGPRYKSGR